jgi:hypothetical protein
MLQGIFKYIFFTLTIVTQNVNPGFSQGELPQPVKVMFYNVENLFDIYNDSLTDDNDFLPEGVMRWNLKRYQKKINSLYKTIIAAGEWEPPAIVAFCEIENRKVLEDLVFGTYLSKYGYSIIHEDSPDRRGIDVCLIFRKKIAKIIDYDYWIPKDINGQGFNSRSVLYTKLAVRTDTINLIVNHWPSRRGGVLAGENYRHLVASMVRAKVDSIIKRDQSGARVIILGDFNCTPDDQVLKYLICPGDTSIPLINLSENMEFKDPGTYRFQGIWEMIDQVIVSGRLISSPVGLYTDRAFLKIFKPDFLMKKDPKYPGLSPFPTYRGYSYQGGFSDHLPVLLELRMK